MLQNDGSYLANHAPSQVGMVFARPAGGRFMQPSIDTILVCRGLVDALAGVQVKRLIDVGSGSGP